MSLLSESFDIDITTRWWLFPEYQGDQFIKFCDIWTKNQNPVQTISFIVVCKNHSELQLFIMQDIKTIDHNRIRATYEPWVPLPEEEYLKSVDMDQMWKFFCRELQSAYPNAELINI